MSVTPANLVPAPAGPHFAPIAPARVGVSDFDYLEEEWFASGTESGRDYTTAVLVRLPRERERFSGTVVVEPLHFSGIGPIWIYSAEYLMRSGHGYAMVASQGSTIGEHLAAWDEARYASLHITIPEVEQVMVEGPLGTADQDVLDATWETMSARNRACSTILAQVGAALREEGGPFGEARHVFLAGHSQTGWVVTRYIDEAHDEERFADGRPVFDGYFPAGYPTTPFRGIDAPIVQVMSDGDVAHPTRSFTIGYDGRAYRREDCDDPGDRFRLYELAAMPHSGTRYEPYSSTALWNGQTDGAVTMDMHMSTLPHNELFNAALDHLLRWVVDGTTPPVADRLAVGPDGYFATDEHGNTVGGVRCAELDVPAKRYHPTIPQPDGTVAFSSVGTEEPFPPELVARLHGDQETYRQRYRARLTELVDEGWLLPEDAELLRTQLENDRERVA